MSTNEHLTEIRAIVDIWIATARRMDMMGVLADIEQIPPHLDALAAQLEAERARVARLQAALRAMGSLVDHIGRRESAHYPSMLSEDAKSEMGLQPGDLPDEEATR